MICFSMHLSYAFVKALCNFPADYEASAGHPVSRAVRADCRQFALSVGLKKCGVMLASKHSRPTPINNPFRSESTIKMAREIMIPQPTQDKSTSFLTSLPLPVNRTSSLLTPVFNQLKQKNRRRVLARNAGH
jgi:hypothetical protein